MFAIKVSFMSGPDDGLEVWLKSDEKGKLNPNRYGWRFSIGRSEESDLVIAYDTQVSRTHAYICVTHADLWLEDAGSRNGTLVGEKPIKGKCDMLLYELFRIGRTWLRIDELIV